jgi:hypothetical protein
MQEKWNAAIDTYIASSGDPRPTLAIERAAKIGVTGGPLYRTCEGGGCTQMEPDVTLFTCSKCRTVSVLSEIIFHARLTSRHSISRFTVALLARSGPALLRTSAPC